MTDIINLQSAGFAAAPMPGGATAGEIAWALPDRAGLWRADESNMAKVAPYHFHTDEVVYIVEGAVDIEIIDGSSYHLEAGDLASFPAGKDSTWTFTFPFAKVSVLLS
jgi:uncharacterized cupin superfamily protein